MASISKRNGKYAVTYYEGDDRHPVMKSGLTASQAEKLRDKKNAEEKKWREQRKKAREKAKKQVVKAVSNNAGDNPTDATLEEYMEEFIEKYGTKHWGDSYYTSSRSRMINYVYPHFGQHKIVDITTQMIDTYYDFLIKECPLVANRGKQKGSDEGGHVTSAIVRDIHKVLRTAFNQARKWKYIRQNPFNDADLPEHKEEERPAFSPDEFEWILDYTDDPSDYERYTIHVALAIQYYCTTRGGEVGGLQWPDYNRTEKTLHIYKALDRVAKKNLNLPKLIIYYTFPIMNAYNKTVVVLKAPKTEATERFSKLNNLMIEKLDQLKKMQEEMIANTEYGLFAQKMSGGSVNTASGEFNFSVDKAFIVEKGKIKQQVKGAKLIGSGIEVLQQIDMVGNDMDLACGMCGASSGSIPTTVGEPAVRVRNITVGGQR